MFRIVPPTGLVRMDHSWPYPFGDSGDEKNGAPIVEGLHNVHILDPPGSRVHGMDPDRPPVTPFLQNPMTRNLRQPNGVSIIMGMEIVSRMGRDKL